MTNPIETATKVSIISRAAILCGEDPINDLTENRYCVTVASNLFEVLYENEIQQSAWRFAMTKKALSRVNDTPINQFRYIFQIPSDCLLPVGAYPRATYEIYGDKIYTNQSAMDLEYKFKPEVSALPAYFSLLLTYEIARAMVKSVSEDDTGWKIADSRYKQQLNIAQFADAQGRPPMTVPDAFTSVRGFAPIR